MRRLSLLVLIALVVPLACKKPDGGGDAGPDGASSASASASASAAPPDTASATATPPAAPPAPAPATAVPLGPPAAGNGCRSGVDTNACSADKNSELTCSGGIWHVLQM